MNNRDSFRNELSKIRELDSPQINAYNLENKNIPVSFSFRFKNTSYKDPIYSKIHEIIKQYNGGIKWIMHNKGSRINYTIEPEVFFNARLKIEEMKLDISLVDFLGEKYIETYCKAIKDIDSLCLFIKNNKKLVV